MNCAMTQEMSWVLEARIESRVICFKQDDAHTDRTVDFVTC